jgi:hypothetical protein
MNERQAGNALVGAWRLLSWENRTADGQVTYPMGTDVVGYLLYTADGRFSVLISRAGRAGFAVGDLLSGTTEEKARAVEGFVAYGGPLQLPWRPGGASRGTVVVPQLGRRRQQRSVELTGDRLTLSAKPPLLAGKQQVPRLVWERVDPSPGAAA